MKNRNVFNKIVLAFILIFALTLGACAPRDSGDGESVETQTQVDVGTADNGRVVISHDGDARFSIVISENLGNDEKLGETINALVNYFVSATGAAPRILSPDSETYDADATEILIGDTGYAESNEVYQAIGYGEWTIRFCGYKLVLAGCSPSALDTATFTLLQTLKREKEDKTLSLAAIQYHPS